MDQSTCAPSSNTSTRDAVAQHHEVRPVLRSVGLPGVEQLPPRPTPPKQTLTARPVAWIPTDADVDHALGAYGTAPYRPGGSAA